MVIFCVLLPPFLLREDNFWKLPCKLKNYHFPVQIYSFHSILSLSVILYLDSLLMNGESCFHHKQFSEMEKRRDDMSEITVRKRGKYWEYSFEGAKIKGKRKRISKSGFRTKLTHLLPESRPRQNSMKPDFISFRLKSALTIFLTIGWKHIVKLIWSRSPWQTMKKALVAHQAGIGNL